MDAIKELYNIDIKENYIRDLDAALLAILIKDKSSGKNIIWATDTYKHRGIGYLPQDYITVEAITGIGGNIIKPRTEKTKKEQQQRIKNKAEVFTPSWICNKQNNLVDSAWFGRENVFNTENDAEKSWTTNVEKIVFPDGKTWQEYVSENRMEITCGEAPYLTSRYDTVTGESIDIKNRIGLLDRKLRIISENVDDEQEWYKWAQIAFKSIYGFDFQGDNVLIARENLLFAFIEAYVDKFNMPPIKEYLIAIAKILAWNIWQMDGLKFVIPYSCKKRLPLQQSFFDDMNEPQECEGCKKNDNRKHTGIYCKIMNWKRNRSELFIDQLKEKKSD